MNAQVIPVTRTVYIESKIHIIECADCSIDFGIGDDFMKRRRADHQSFYCPNGHSLSYKGPSDAEKRATRAERELEAARSLAQRESGRRQRAEADARTSDYRARAAKGQLTKTKKRIAAGVCPCCQRTFQNLSSHMAGQHPGYAGVEATS
ncbi:hypothetical protein [Nocardioides sp. InS609-2]|uniref:hypothetical protein n=1 Tax=Nocardioides sp. InS609-2 TaxID=2760705 RepID=UPI0020BFE7BB|nr:hypothetical protein [Nocardioides sp. InS609-2]